MFCSIGLKENCAVKKSTVTTRRPTWSGAAAMALTLLVTVGITWTATSASADTTLRAAFTKECPQNVPTACLWVDGREGNSGQTAMITSVDGKPDMINNTLRGLTPQFTDNISVGYNGLPFDLCLYDTSQDNLRQDQNRWVTKKVMGLPSGGSFAQLADYNDVFDRYTTANPGGCPQYAEFYYDSGKIISDRSPS